MNAANDANEGKNVKRRIKILPTVVAVAATLVACGSLDRGVVTSKIHVPAGTPNTKTGGGHAEQWFIYCQNQRTKVIHDVVATKAEYDRTKVGDPCDVNR